MRSYTLKPNWQVLGYFFRCGENAATSMVQGLRLCGRCNTANGKARTASS